MNSPSQHLLQRALQCLLESVPEAKVQAVHQLRKDWQGGDLSLQPLDHELPEVPGRPDRPQLVAPRELPKRKLGSEKGRAALIHALAHIEFNAINLACDAICRFPGLPRDYYADWLQVADEEALHFTLLQQRMAAHDCAYGDFPAHNGLWMIAMQTAADPLHRMALVPRVMEARGLDVTPGMIEKFAALGDDETAEVLRIIWRDEITHVAIGTRWFQHLCSQQSLDPETTYFRLLEQYLRNAVRGPFHRKARTQAGFTESELDRLEQVGASAQSPETRSA